MQFFTDLCHVQAARAAGEVGRICAELVFGYNRHPRWDDDERGLLRARRARRARGHHARESSAARHGDVVEADGSHPDKAGPCVEFQGLEPFRLLRTKLDGCLTGSRLAKDRAARSLDARDDSRGAGLPRYEAGMERAQMDVDIVCVGFGPATGGFLTTLLA